MRKKLPHACLEVHNVGNKGLPGYVGPLNSHHSCAPVARHPAEPKWGGFKVLSLPLSFPEVITAVPRSVFSGFFLSCWFSILLKYNRSMGVLRPQIYSSTAEKKAESRGEAAFLSIKIKSGLKSDCVSQSAECFSSWSLMESSRQIPPCCSSAGLCQPLPPRPLKYFISVVS